MKKNKNKGFTLTELIIVIVIIGILAAVLIPSLSGYIKKAKRSNDVQTASQMSKELSLYCIENDINQNKLLGTDVRTILNFKGFDLTPSTSDWTYVYNRDKNIVEVQDFSDGVLAADNDFSFANDPTQIKENLFLIGKGTTDLEQAIYILISSPEEWNKAHELLKNTIYNSLINKFDPQVTLFISNYNGYTTYSGSNKITYFVYLENTVMLPNINTMVRNDIFDEYFSPVKSQIIKQCEPNSYLIKFYNNVEIVDENKLAKIDVTVTNGTPIIKLGENYSKSLYQEIYTYIIAIKSYKNLTSKEEKDDSGDVFTYKVVVNYYDENGLFARGSATYNIKDGSTLPY